MPNRVPATKNTDKLKILQAEVLKEFPWLIHGFSTRLGGVSRAYRPGDLNLGFTKDDKKPAVERNRQIFLQQVGATHSMSHRRNGANHRGGKPSGLWPIVTLRQVHSDVIRFVSGADGEIQAGDGLITNQACLLLGVQAADCLPVILVDPKKRAIGVFHAGWRGTFRRIVEKGVGAMRLHFGSRASDLRAAIGPGIHSCCYEVGEEIRSKFEAQFSYGASLFHEVKDSDPVREKYPLLFLTARAPGHSVLPKKIFLDLAKANRQQLLGAGVRARYIESSSLCTNCNSELLFSYRAERGKTGRLMGVAGIREG